MFKRIALNSLLVLCSIAVALLLGEAAARGFVILLDRPPVLVSDPHAGWQGKAGLRDVLKSYPDGLFRISSDRHGRRVSYSETGSAPDGAPAVLLLGDSFVHGVGVADDETFAWRLARALPYKVINLGVTGYGTDQMLLKLEQFLAANPDTPVHSIVVFVFDNDFTDVQRAGDPNLGRSKPRFALENGALLRGDYARPWPDRLMDWSYLFWILKSKLSTRFLPPRPTEAHGIQLVETILEEIRALADARGVPLHILAHHRLLEPLPLPESSWNGFLERAGAVDITDPMRQALGPDAVGSDGLHWSAEGHRWLASRLEAELKRGR